MDRIGDANKSTDTRMQDRDETANPTPVINTPQDDVDIGVDTSQFLKSELVFGLEYMFNLRSPVLPKEMAPKFEAMAVENNVERRCNLDEFEGNPMLLVFYPRIMTEESESTMNLLTDVSLTPEMNLQLVAVSTDTTDTIKAWSEGREAGPPQVVLISDKNGDISRDYGVLDTVNHEALHSVFIIDSQGIVQGSRKSYCGALYPFTAADMLDFVHSCLRQTRPNTSSTPNSTGSSTQKSTLGSSSRNTIGFSTSNTIGSSSRNTIGSSTSNTIGSTSNTIGSSSNNTIGSASNNTKGTSSKITTGSRSKNTITTTGSSSSNTIGSSSNNTIGSSTNNTIGSSTNNTMGSTAVNSTNDSATINNSGSLPNRSSAGSHTDNRGSFTKNSTVVSHTANSSETPGPGGIKSSVSAGTNSSETPGPGGIKSSVSARTNSSETPGPGGIKSSVSARTNRISSFRSRQRTFQHCW